MAIARLPAMQASNTMTRDVIVVPRELTFSIACSVMARERIRHLPDVRAGVLIGMLSDREVPAHGTMSKDGLIQQLRLVGLVTSTDLRSLLLQREGRSATDPLPLEVHLTEMHDEPKTLATGDDAAVVRRVEPSKHEPT
jgi:CBS domain-containing protein